MNSTPLLLPERLAEIKARFDAAMPGPWETESHSNVRIDETYEAVEGPDGKTLFDAANSEVMELHTEHDEEGGVWNWDETGRRNLEFAAAARQDVPDLLAHIDASRDAVELYRLIGELREASELGTITICCTSRSLDQPPEQVSVEAHWTQWEPRLFRGNTLAECLQAALKVARPSLLDMKGCLEKKA